MRPCGIATPCPRPVEPSFSRAARLAATPARARPEPCSNTAPIAVKNCALSATSRSVTMLARGSSFAISPIAEIRAAARGLRGAAALAACRSVCKRRRLDAVYPALLLVPQHLAVELVGEQVDRRVHIGIDALGVEVLAADVHVGFDDLLQLVDGKHDAHVDHMVEMPVDPLELGDDVRADGRGDFEVIAGEGQIHQALLVDCAVSAGGAPRDAVLRQVRDRSVKGPCACSRAGSAAPRGILRSCGAPPEYPV